MKVPIAYRKLFECSSWCTWEALCLEPGDVFKRLYLVRCHKKGPR